MPEGVKNRWSIQTKYLFILVWKEIPIIFFSGSKTDHQPHLRAKKVYGNVPKMSRFNFRLLNNQEAWSSAIFTIFEKNQKVVWILCLTSLNATQKIPLSIMLFIVYQPNWLWKQMIWPKSTAVSVWYRQQVSYFNDIKVVSFKGKRSLKNKRTLSISINAYLSQRSQ